MTLGHTRLLTGFLTVAAMGAQAESLAAGTWEGTENGLPSVELTIHDNDGRISGVIGFYFQSRGDDGKWHLGAKFAVPLLSPRLQSNVLMFETIHHARHGSAELGPNNKYRVTFIAANEARLNILKNRAQDNDPRSGAKLILRK